MSPAVVVLAQVAALVLGLTTLVMGGAIVVISWTGVVSLVACWLAGALVAQAAAFAWLRRRRERSR